MNTIVLIANPGKGIKAARELVKKAGLEPGITQRTFSAFSSDNKIAAYFTTEKDFPQREIKEGFRICTSSRFPELPANYKKLPGCCSEAIPLPLELEGLLFKEGV